MSELGFELLGHDNPLGRYPAPVVPIGKLNDDLVAIYAGSDGPQVLTLAEGLLYVSYDDSLTAKLKTFDYRRDRLFAFEEHEVAFYHAAEEHEYFGQLLRDSHFSKDNPFLRFSLAKTIFTPDSIIDELYRCVANLSHFAHEEFIDNWYGRERAAILNKIDVQYHLRLPVIWKVLLLIEQARRPAVGRPQQGFFGRSSSPSGGSAAGAAMSTALVVVSVFKTRTSAEYAYRLLLERNYDYKDVNLLLLERSFESLFPELREGRSGINDDVDPTSLAGLLLYREYADLSNSRIVCAGPHAKQFAGMRDAAVHADLIAGLTASGLSEDQARLCEQGIRHGGILMGVSSVSDADEWYFENEWIEI